MTRKALTLDDFEEILRTLVCQSFGIVAKNTSYGVSNCTVG